MNNKTIQNLTETANEIGTMWGLEWSNLWNTSQVKATRTDTTTEW